MKRLPALLITLLIIEWIDEAVFSSHETAWPLIRADLHLSYTQIGLLLSLPGLCGALIEPVLGILGDTWKRRSLILGGGLVFSVSLAIMSLSRGFFSLLLPSCALNPASGAFVSLSQASLMDVDPTRHEQNMARWTLAGSVGVVSGPLLLGASTALGAGWRGLMLGLAVVTVLMVAFSARKIPSVGACQPEGQMVESVSFSEGIRRAGRALKRAEVLRWLILLEFSDLMLDVFYGFLALYLVDVVHLTPQAAGFGVAVWTGVGLLGDFLLIPLLERVNGLDYMRVSVAAEMLLFPAFLLIPSVVGKIVILGLLGLFNAGWYSVLQGRLYSAMPGQSGTVMTMTNVFGWAGKLFPLVVGLAAERFGMGTAMWLLLAGPLALAVGLPGKSTLQLN